MSKRVLVGYALLLACFLAPAPVSPLAVDGGGGHALRNFQAARMNRLGMGQHVGTRNLAASNRFQDRHDFKLAGVGHAFGHAFRHAAGLFHHPPGWDRGKKTGWHGSDVPPGLAKKQSRFAFLRHGPFARRELRDENINRPGVANFDRFLDLNPGLEKSLGQNPSLIDNQAFLADHPALGAWLKAHPQAAEELRENPRAFLKLEHRFDAHEAFRRGDADLNRREVANFDRFLDSNPSLAAALSHNPSLVNNPSFLANNPSLGAWLKTHPEAAQELRENPRAFFRVEQRFEATRPEDLEASSSL